MIESPRIGVIGGSGLYSLLENPIVVDQATPYGATSSPVTIGELGGRQVAFLTRHGVNHTLAPHQVPYRANIWALAKVGVKALVSSSAVGSLTTTLPPGSFVVPHQYLDFTRSRVNTFFDDQELVEHLAAPDPFDAVLQRLTADVVAATVGNVANGTVAVIEGPRFASRAESQMYKALGGDIINMTLLPEVPLALELGIGVSNISFVTDLDAAVPRDHADAVNANLVFERLAQAQPVIKQMIADITTQLPDDYASDVPVNQAAVAHVLNKFV